MNMSSEEGYELLKKGVACKAKENIADFCSNTFKRSDALGVHFLDAAYIVLSSLFMGLVLTMLAIKHAGSEDKGFDIDIDTEVDLFSEMFRAKLEAVMEAKKIEKRGENGK